MADRQTSSTTAAAGVGPAKRVRCVKSPATKISLPVLRSKDARATTVAPSRASRWRALSLILVHVAILAHILHWWFTGRTVSPVEPSESMYTLETGIVNAGFLFFAGAILVTTIAGRFVCGWGCHIIALQDLCGHLLKRTGLRPRPFRSRFLVWVPLLVALYMFVWPTFHREIIGRLTGDYTPLHGVTHELIVHDYWATFPSIPVAIPFILICTFGVVYFLGNKGYCTYCCPYGGFFSLADRLSPIRIRVTDQCNHCGHCTATCTSNVRVHEEVRDFGMVRDPGCMKCLDCVTVCPNDALYVGLGKPALFAGLRNGADAARAASAKEARARRFDLSRAEEVVAAVVFAVAFYGFRSLYDAIPMLMALGIGVIAAFFTLMALRAARTPSVSVHRLTLRERGRMRPFGVAWCFAAAAILLVAAWGCICNGLESIGARGYARMDVPFEVMLRPEFEPPPTIAAKAQYAIRWFDAADRFKALGLWKPSADDHARRAYLLLATGDLSGCEASLATAIRVGQPAESAPLHLANLMRRRGATDDEIGGPEGMLAHTLQRHPDMHLVRAQLAARHAGLLGDPKSGAALWETALADHSKAWPRKFDPDLFIHAATYFASIGEVPRAQELLRNALTEDPTGPHTLGQVALIRSQLGDPAGAKESLGAAIEHHKEGATWYLRCLRLVQLSETAFRLGDSALGKQLLDQAQNLADDAGNSRPPLELAFVHFSTGGTEAGLRTLKKAVTGADTTWQHLGLASRLREAGHSVGSPELIEESVKQAQLAADSEPGLALAVLELAASLFAAGRTDDAFRAGEAAAAASPSSAAVAERLADLYDAGDRSLDAARWRDAASRLQSR